MNLPKRILVPVDFSPASEAALDFAATLAKAGGASIVVLHVWEPPFDWVRAFAPDGTAIALPLFSDSEEGTRMRQYLAKLEQQGIAASGSLEQGDRARAINRSAENAGCDLIIIGAHDMTSRAWLIGLHISDRVVRNAHCPVIVVHPTPPAVRTQTGLVPQTGKDNDHERDREHPQR